MKDVVINVKGMLSQNGYEEETEFSTLGQMKTEEGKTVLSYVGMFGKNDVTEVTIENGYVVLKKEDETFGDAVIVLEENKVYSCYYNTPLGLINLTVYPTVIHLFEDDNEGCIELEYISTIGDNQSTNRLVVTYHRQEE
jgi:uncharacterized beta-barrel protein YwiB (DUF1934 family)